MNPTASQAQRIVTVVYDLTCNETGGFALCLFFSDLVISAQRVNGPESFIIEIEKSKVNGLLAEFEGDLNFLAQFLRLQDKRMVLINPVRITHFQTIELSNAMKYSNRNSSLAIREALRKVNPFKKRTSRSRMRIKLEMARARVKSCRRTAPWMPWMSQEARQKKMMGRLRLSQWPKWPSMMSLRLHLRIRAQSLRLKRAARALVLRARQRLPRLKLRPKQRETLNKNKLNKIIKLRIEFKFERFGLDLVGVGEPPRDNLLDPSLVQRCFTEYIQALFAISILFIIIIKYV